MSTADPARPARQAEPYAPASSSRNGVYVDDMHGYGWVVFAGIMLSILGTLNLIDGIAAVSKSKFFTANATYIVSDLKTWGWVLIVMGCIQLGLALGVWAQVKSIRWFAVAIAALNAIVQLIFIPAYPFWSLTLFTLDILVIYGLVAYGARPATS